MTRKQSLLPTVLIPLVAGIIFTPQVANGQIVPDETLGEESSTVRQDNIKGIDSDIIEGGATRGANLFHSFEEFNVDAGRGAYFANPDAIDNILSRVTGSNSSQILGTLGVLGDANLFLINPNGILFGANARLDVGGSFFAATADSLLFDNGFEFSGSNPEAPPLLTVNIPVGLGFRDNPGDIENRSVSENLGLQVPTEETLALIGGDVSFEGGKITAPGGKVELGGLLAEGTVNISENVSLTFPDGVTRADVFLSDSAFVNVANRGGGFINVNARNLDLLGGSELFGGIAAGLDATGNSAGDINLNATGEINLSQVSSVQNRVNEGAIGNGGDIEVQADALNFTEGGFFSASTFGQGNAGNIVVDVSGEVKLDGLDRDLTSISRMSSVITEGTEGEGGDIRINSSLLSLTNGGLLNTSVFSATDESPGGKGNAGDITINVSGELEISGFNQATNSFSSITSSLGTGAEGNAGNIDIKARSLSLVEEAEITTEAFQDGNAGNITINASNTVSLDSGSNIDSSSGFGQSSSGEVNITAGSFYLNNEDSFIRSSVFGKGNAGNVMIEAEDAVELVGGDIFSNVEAGAEGKGGNIKISGQSLSLIDGTQLQTLVRAKEDNTPAGQGNAGNVTIDVDGEVSVSDKDANDNFSAIFSSLGTGAIGNAGNIELSARSLSLENGGFLSISTFGQGNAGNVTIEAEGAVELVGGDIFSTVGSDAKGNGGEINISANSLSLAEEAEITTEAFQDGNAGNITINASDTISLDSVSKIDSSSGFGQSSSGGVVNITTGSLFLSNGSYISSSTYGEGNAGNIEVDATDSLILSGVAPYPKLEDGRAGGFSSALITATEEDAKGQGGKIRVNTNRLQISDGAVFSTRSRSDFPGGNIEVKANVLEVTGGGQILTTAFRKGNAGNINLKISDRISLSGSDPTYFDRFNQVAEAFNESEASTRIDPVSPESGIFANTKLDSRGAGAGGKIEIDTGQLLVSDGAQISASTSGTGKGGELTIRARQGVELSGTGSEKFDEAIEESLRLGAANDDLKELLTTAPFSTATVSTGAAGTIAIDTPSLLLRDGAILSSTTFGKGDAGGIDINAESVELLGSGLVAGTFNGNAEASGGNIEIDTGKLSLQKGGRILATTFSQGTGGNVDVTASESVELGSTPDDVILPTTINTSSVFGTGGAGNVTIESPKLIVRDGAQIVTTSGSDSLPEPIKLGGTGGDIKVTASESIEISGISPDGQFKSALTAESFSGSAAGNINISSDSLTLNNNSEISAATASGEGGNIALAIADILLLENNSPITTEAGGTGKGGDIKISADFTILKESEIIANAFKGAGGNINITTQGLFQRNSKIDASSELGIDGVVKLNTPDIDPSQGVVELPVNVQDPNKLIAQDACKQGIGSSLVVTGRGGLPPTANQNFNSNWVDVDLLQPIPPEDQSSLESDREANSLSSTDAARQNRLIPAEGWVRNEKGEIFLVAYKSSNDNSQRQHNSDRCKPK